MNRLQTKQLLSTQSLAPHKRLGQNFLVRPGAARRIVALAGLSPEDEALEVGVGLGALTKPLAAACARVTGIEVDSGIIRLHEEQRDLPENVTLVHADILQAELASFCGRGKKLNIVANLPYAISTPFLFRLIEQRECLRSAVLMLQKEVALRLAAGPGSKDYGAPTVLLAAAATVEPLFSVGPEAFYPRPQVQSLVVRLVFDPEPAGLKDLGPFDRHLFSRIVRAAFARRRKTLVNALGVLIPDKNRLAALLASINLAPDARGETLALADYIRLCQGLSAAGLI